mmetsp:Transcript_75066/g.119356  ORF Transcript_75066/g.119356 Transcript_75066/m.119356 type:complete len:308 (-) Transcript_75066:865-1788(-)
MNRRFDVTQQVINAGIARFIRYAVHAALPLLVAANIGEHIANRLLLEFHVIMHVFAERTAQAVDKLNRLDLRSVDVLGRVLLIDLRLHLSQLLLERLQFVANANLIRRHRLRVQLVFVVLAEQVLDRHADLLQIVAERRPRVQSLQLFFKRHTLLQCLDQIVHVELVELLRLRQHLGHVLASQLAKLPANIASHVPITRIDADIVFVVLQQLVLEPLESALQVFNARLFSAGSKDSAVGLQLSASHPADEVRAFVVAQHIDHFARISQCFHAFFPIHGRRGIRHPEIVVNVLLQLLSAFFHVQFQAL